MVNPRRAFYNALLLFAALLPAAGCGKPAPPPAGSPQSATTPTVDLGVESSPQEAGAGSADSSSGSGSPQAGAARAADWGTLKGRFVFDGKAPTPATIDTSKDPTCKMKLVDESLLVDDKGELANAVVTLRTKGVAVNPAYESSAKDNVELDNKNCRFEPHVLVVRTSQTLNLKNSDPTGHNTNVASISNDAINPILAAGSDPLKHEFARPEVRPVKVGCNIHTWMGAWLIVRNDPYAAVSAKDGTFEIKDLPAGKELEFGLWHEKAGYLKNAKFKGGTSDSRGNFKITLKPGDNKLGDIKVSSAIFK